MIADAIHNLRPSFLDGLKNTLHIEKNRYELYMLEVLKESREIVYSEEVKGDNLIGLLK
ncbi:hypothetical protein CBY_1882 [Clostridium butyricum 5521]|uniref:Uncharacterized protein n=2 Tax=Clostridium butyricum TaxID=1492 RepID=C4IGI8_CLOBU|nr:hypothetical protein CBY_1882 [Clostridium butyricum 5521]EEP54151.1 hypothetical protein CLP_1944 [Clostridium butyricum E4 str. BoNT E BL5262]